MCKCWSQWLLIAVIFAFSLMTLLTGCGIKGPLYLPEEGKQEQKQKKPAKEEAAETAKKVKKESQGK